MRWDVTFDVSVDSGIKLELPLFPLQRLSERLDALYASDSRRNQDASAKGDVALLVPVNRRDGAFLRRRRKGLKQGRDPQFFNVPINPAEPARVPVIAGNS